MRQRQSSHASGRQAETLAADYLNRHGLDVIDRNFRCRFGEIDLVARDRETLVFIEVKYRRQQQHMAVVETIDRRKLKRLITTSEYFLTRNRQYKNQQCRYDVITITESRQAPVIEWIKNAFQA